MGRLTAEQLKQQLDTAKQEREALKATAAQQAAQAATTGQAIQDHRSMPAKDRPTGIVKPEQT